MAIRFVDVEPEKHGGDEPAPRRHARVSDDAPRPEAAAAAVPDEADAAPADAVSAVSEEAAPPPVLPHAKPEPKPRGRKKPMSAVGADKSREQKDQAAKASDAPSAPLLEGLLPELQAHAKPTPKPRGRKKAFG